MLRSVSHSTRARLNRATGWRMRLSTSARRCSSITISQYHEIPVPNTLVPLYPHHPRLQPTRDDHHSLARTHDCRSPLVKTHPRSISHEALTRGAQRSRAINFSAYSTVSLSRRSKDRSEMGVKPFWIPPGTVLGLFRHSQCIVPSVHTQEALCQDEICSLVLLLARRTDSTSSVGL